MSLWKAVAAQITEITQESFAVTGIRGVGGGCINATDVIDNGKRTYFVKHNHADKVEMLAAEAEGLTTLAATRTVRVPLPVCTGIAAGRAYLVLEFLELDRASQSAQERLGYQLAALHRVTQKQFGWHRANTIGSTPQSNRYADRWVDFFRHERLGPQFTLAERHGRHHSLLNKGERLRADLDVFFLSYRPQASMLHGDLWAGNAAETSDAQPVIFDPSVYFGDRETDLAMTELFGGFAPRFYDAYREALPVDPGYTVRRTLYNLYHVLNHANLFEGGYWKQAEQMLDALLVEIR